MLAFDTHMFYKKLQRSEFSEKQAEVITDLFQETQKQAFGEISKELVSKEDLFITKQELQKEIRSLDLKIEQIKSDLRVEIRQTKVETIKWVVSLMLAQTGIIAALVKIL